MGLNAAPTGANRGVISTYASLPHSSLLGLEWTFSFAAGTFWVMGTLAWGNPVNTWWAHLRYNHQNNFSEYIAFGGAYVQVPGSAWLTTLSTP